MSFNCSDLIQLFNPLFQTTEQTILTGGGTEPLYLPKSIQSPYHQIIFTHDYFSSALHEIAHWCIAGKERRKQIDYGYWYQPDGRAEADQTLFEQVEVKPQAIEWIFSAAAGARFRVSADNLHGDNKASGPFKHSIYQQTLFYLHKGLPVQAELFKQALLDFYQRADIFSTAVFLLEDL